MASTSSATRPTSLNRAGSTRSSTKKNGPKRGFSLVKARPEIDCCICLLETATVLYVPCGHACLCAECSEKTSMCPLCRTWCTHKVDLAHLVHEEGVEPEPYDRPLESPIDFDKSAELAELESSQLDLVESLRKTFAETGQIDLDVLTSIGDSVLKSENTKLLIVGLHLYNEVAQRFAGTMRRRHLYAYVVPSTQHSRPGIRRFAEKLAKHILRNEDSLEKGDITLASTVDDDEDAASDVTMMAEMDQDSEAITPCLLIYNDPVSVVYQTGTCKLGTIEVPMVAQSHLTDGLYSSGCAVFPHPGSANADDNHLLIHNLQTDTWFKSISLNTPLDEACLVASRVWNQTSRNQIDCILIFKTDHPVEMFKFDPQTTTCVTRQVGSRIPTQGEQLLAVDCDTHVVVIDQESTVFKYNVARPGWKAIRDLEQDVRTSSAVYHDGWMYVIGVGEFANSCYRLNIETEQWHTMAYMQVPRIGHKTVYQDGYIYVIGGGCRVGGRANLWPQQFTASFNGEKYCIETNTWSPIDRLPPITVANGLTAIALDRVPVGVRLIAQPAPEPSAPDQASSQAAEPRLPARSKARGANNTRRCAVM